MTHNIAQMTWFRSANYGSLLQAFALQRAIASLGCSSDLVDYDPAPYQQRNQSALRKSRLFRAARKTQLSIAGSAPYVSCSKSQAFSSFIAENLSLTASVSSKEDFLRLNEAYDYFICGSDQIWSPRCFDPHYYLDYVLDTEKKIAYAPSFGCDNLPTGLTPVIGGLVSSFSRVSARERRGAEMIGGLGVKGCRIVCDPVLLLEEHQWRVYIGEPKQRHRNYCLCYFLGRSKENWARARAIAAEKGLEFVVIPVFNGDARRNADVVDGVGPREFLELIAGSSYVCTDSFHGLVFATVFQRDFSVFERFRSGSAGSQNVRIDNYLEITGLQHRLLKRGSSRMDIDKSNPIDYLPVSQRVDAFRKESLDFLRESLWRIDPTGGQAQNERI